MTYEQLPSALSPIVQRDLDANVVIGEVFSGYFNSPEKAAVFCELGVSGIQHMLPQSLRAADFGGGDGYLAASIRDYLASQGKTTDFFVVDGNESYLALAERKGLTAVHTDLTAATIDNLDLVVSRATFHYNSLDAQAAILDRVRESLTPNGFFVNQISSGDRYNTALRNDISALPSLDRASKGSIHFVTPDEYISMTAGAGLETLLVGYAPANSWTPEEMFDRFHPHQDGEAQFGDNAPRTVFLRECMALIRDYTDSTSIEGITFSEDSVRVEYQYPIFVSRLAA